MLSWVIDHVNVLYFLLVTIAFLLAAVGWTSRQTKYFLYAAGVFGAMMLLFVLSRVVITDQKQISLNIDAMANAAANQNIDRLFDHVSKDFRHGPHNRDEISKRIAAAVKMHKVRSAYAWDKQVKVDGDQATAIFNFRVDAEGGTAFIASAKAKFLREGKDWKLNEIQILKLGTNDRQFVPGLD